MNSKEILKRSKLRVELQYHEPNINKHAEEYAHHMLLLLYLLKNEEQLKFPPNYVIYLAKIQKTGVFDIR